LGYNLRRIPISLDSNTEIWLWPFLNGDKKSPSRVDVGFPASTAQRYSHGKDYIRLELLPKSLEPGVHEKIPVKTPFFGKYFRKNLHLGIFI
jgi:hypothetical protein